MSEDVWGDRRWQLGPPGLPSPVRSVLAVSSRRLSAAPTDLVTVAPPDRRGPLERQLRLMTAAVHRAHDDEEDARAALLPDAEGIGAGADVTDRPLLLAVVGAVATSGA